jgi:hypothetical protein
MPYFKRQQSSRPYAESTSSEKPYLKQTASTVPYCCGETSPPESPKRSTSAGLEVNHVANEPRHDECAASSGVPNICTQALDKMNIAQIAKQLRSK